MNRAYFTLGHDQPGFPGYIMVDHDDSLCAAREAVWKFTKGRFAFQYDSVEEIHHMDRKMVVHLEAVMTENESSLPKVLEVHPDIHLDIFEGFEHAI